MFEILNAILEKLVYSISKEDAESTLYRGQADAIIRKLSPFAGHCPCPSKFNSVSPYSCQLLSPIFTTVILTHCWVMTKHSLVRCMGTSSPWIYVMYPNRLSLFPCPPGWKELHSRLVLRHWV